MKKIVFFLLLIFGSLKSEAYPSFIAYGYGSCLQCHFNPYGNGPLTDYGRGAFATAIAARPPWSGDASEESLSNASGFLGSQPLPYWIRPSIKARDLILASDVNHHMVFSNIIMQGDANVVLKTEDSRFLASVTLGYQNTAPYSNLSTIISREHYVGARIDDHWGVYGGLMDIAYGLRVPDHEAFSRFETQLAENDQSYGILVHRYDEKFELGAQAFVGNLLQTPADLRPKGLSLTGEFEAFGKSRLGASALFSQSRYQQRSMGSVHSRAVFRNGIALISEVGMISDKARELKSTQNSDYIFNQLLWKFRRGLHGLFTAEAFDSNLLKASDNSYRLSPGVQWFPFQRLELRSDLVCQWFVPAAGSARQFDLSWMAQAHLSL